MGKLRVCFYDKVSDHPGFVVEVEILHFTDDAISRANGVVLHVPYAA